MANTLVLLIIGFLIGFIVNRYFDIKLNKTNIKELEKVGRFSRN